MSSFFPFVSGTLPFGMPFAPLHLINGGSALRRSALCEESGSVEITGEGEIINPEQELMSSMAILMLIFMRGSSVVYKGGYGDFCFAPPDLIFCAGVSA